ncbi:hypothetical protein Y032_0055g2574 [Ancylostoma ceylanicum]|uniref:Uncharacterized protein n=1 Tax=Ancylostoma ceylanicum TaxID=53326 RepID=A0A016U6L1_9BILA|nr:hypothetical protein Y032_0055g2574 [Ancylostoma ceylanicum]
MSHLRIDSETLKPEESPGDADCNGIHCSSNAVKAPSERLPSTVPALTLLKMNVQNADLRSFLSGAITLHNGAMYEQKYTSRVAVD